MTTDKNNAAPDPQPAELAEQQGDHVPDAILRCAIRAFERARKDYKLRLCNEEPQGKKEAIEALSMEAALQAAFALTATGTQQQAGEAHSDDVAVDAFAAAMKAKMADARAKGRGGWEDPAQCSSEDLSRMLRDHVEKGDPRDVANFCMVLHQRREAIAARQPGAQEELCEFLKNSTPLREAALRALGFIDRSDEHGRTAYDCLRRELHAECAAPPAQGIDLGQQRPLIARSLAEWHEDDGNVMWWAWCGQDWAGEPAWCGTPNDSDWPGYHTHWTQHPVQPALIDGQRDAAPGVGNG